MPAILGFLFLVVPLLEIALLIQVGEVIGAWNTILLLIVVSIAGAVLAKREGMAVWRRFRSALERGHVPSTEILDGVLVIFAGALLLTPGFITDILALGLLLPPSRAVVRRALVKASRWLIAKRFPISVPIDMARRRAKTVRARRVPPDTDAPVDTSDNR
jgi:UPF0716 protein FxsA